MCMHAHFLSLSLLFPRYQQRIHHYRVLPNAENKLYIQVCTCFVCACMRMYVRTLYTQYVHMQHHMYVSFVTDHMNFLFSDLTGQPS